MNDRKLFTKIAKKYGAKENDGQGLRIIMPDGEIKPLTEEIMREVLFPFVSDLSIPFVTGMSTGDEPIPKHETWSYNNEACKHCSSNPKNGGSGVCQCILGTPKIT